MKVKRFFIIGFLLGWGISFCPEVMGRGFQEESVGQKGKKSIIRKDLLLREEKTLEPPLRNIFTPHRIRSAGTEFETISSQKNTLNKKKGSELQIRNQDSVLDFDLRYIGFIESGKKIVALIVFDGESLAVEKGELISEGVEIGEITIMDIEVIGPDSNRRKFSLEGEMP